MANYNLTGQQIRDTFEQLGQVSGSIEGGISGAAVVDGTGSRVTTLHVTASNATQAVSASYAPNTGVTSIIAGTNITIDQSTGDVTINSSGGGGAADTGSLLVTASNVDATITYTKGDGSTFQNTINNVANATSASYALTASYAENAGGGGAAFPFIGNAQITGSLVVSQSGLSSGEDVFVLGAPRAGGSSLEGVIRSTVDDGLHFYGNKAFNTGANTFGGGQIYFETGPINVGSAGSPVNIDMQNGSAITASNGTLPIKGDVDVDGNIAIEGTGTTLTVGDATSPAGTPNVNLKQNYSGSTSVFANITIDDTSGTYTKPTLIGRFSNANPIGNVAGDPYTVIAGGGDGGEFLHWGLVMDQSGDLKLLKEVAMRSGANITGSLDISGAITASNASFTSASIGYLQTVTGSATIIGDQYIVLNADSPTARFAGLKVYDSGSGLTGSFEWDSVDDNWIQVETGGSSAGMLTGASGSKGSEVYPTANTLIKGTGNHTVVDSIIIDNGTNATINGDATVTGNTQLNGELNFSTFVDIKQQGANILTGSASNLKLRSDNFSVTDLSNDEYINFDNNLVSSRKNIVATGSISASDGFNSTGFNKSSTFNGTITSLVGSIQSLGGGGITVGNSGYAQQYPSVNVYTNSGSYGGQIYGSHRITDLSGNGDVGIIALSTFNAGDAGKICFEAQHNGDVVWWISENENRFHVEKELKAKAGAQITGSLSVDGNIVATAVTSSNGFSSTGFNKPSTFNGDVSAFSLTTTGAVTAKASFSTTAGFELGEVGTPKKTGYYKVHSDAGSWSGAGNAAGIYIVDANQSDAFVGTIGNFGNPYDAANTASFIVQGGANADSDFQNTIMYASEADGFPHFVKSTYFDKPVIISSNAQITGSLSISGSVNNNIQTVGVTSNTASIDLSSANMFEITLADATTYLFDVTNNGAGKTATLLVKQSPAGTGAVDWGSVFRWSGGTKPAATAGAGKEDMYTLVTYSATEVYAVQTPNMSA